jgi:hypothetical protein
MEAYAIQVAMDDVTIVQIPQPFGNIFNLHGGEE